MLRRRASDLPAVEVKQNARPARHEVPTVPKRPAKGSVRSAPIVVVGGSKYEITCNDQRIMCENRTAVFKVLRGVF